MECAIGTQQQSRRSHGQGTRSSVLAPMQQGVGWAGSGTPLETARAESHRARRCRRSSAVLRIRPYYFKIIIFLCSRARGRYGGASSTLLLCLITDQVDDQELRIVSIYLFIRIFFCTKSIHQNLATFICSSGCAAAGK